MFLKSLEIFGFKSFADRTKIEFSDGISALLGPNGCGKSNVVDAIKWVVGEQSARSLRAESMEDIIFNGTESRKPLSVAEVTITISNEAGTLPLDVPEVAIKRRLYRSGESEYYINGKLAKLKEVRELFWDTGIGKSAYSVMEQGKIDQILSSKPEDRRYLFEEAAGITKHKVRVREAETKLERTEENMKQIEAVLAEVKRSHDSLKHQAEKTVSFRVLKDKVFDVERDVYLLRLRQFIRDKDKRDEEFAAKKQEREKIKAESEALTASMSESLDLVNEMESQLVEMQKSLYGLAVEKNGAEKHKSLIVDRIREIKSKIDQLELRSRSIKDKIAALRDEEADKEAELSDYKTRLKETEKHIEEFESGIKAASLALRSNDEEAAKCGVSIQRIEEEVAAARLALDDITETIVQQLDSRLKEIGYSSAERHTLESEIQALIDRIRTRFESRATLLADVKRSLAYEGKGAADFIDTVLKVVEDLGGASRSLAELAEKFSFYKKTTPSFLDEFLSPEGIITKKRSVDASIAASVERIGTHKATIDELGAENKQLAAKIDTYRRTLEEARLGKTKLQTQMSGAQDALAVFRREIAGQEASLREQETEIFSETRRLGEMGEELSEIDSELAEFDTKGKKLAMEMDSLEKGIAFKNSDLVQRKKDSTRLADKMQSVQTELETIHLSIAQSETEIKNIRENFLELYSRDLSEFEERMFELRTPLSTLRDELSTYRGKLKDLGSVNLMAPEEYKEVKERYDFLSGQMADLQKARDDLRQITDEIRNESAELFLETYNKIKKNFHNMFRRLFGGGRAELRLSDPDHILESGIEILAQPPGKKLEAISLLSGGEKTLTAIALLFATYMVKPSPFCFLDEIDAALDEANVIRFINLLREFSRTSQFIVISHNKKTVSGADTLLGVTMEESGITKAIAVKLEHHQAGEASLVMMPLGEKIEDEDVEFEAGRELAPSPGEKKEATDA
ncbi:MAG TPA: AAA family ATPase [Rectinemataceae bacterium]|nr:AAA family ATPase [Rectinemataceae bacterium]